MATGRLAALNITNSATDLLLYTVPNNIIASFSICLTNRNATPVTVRLALTTGATVLDGDYIAYEVTIYGHEVYERSGFVLTQGQFVYVRSSATSVNAVMYGYEE